MKCNLSELAHMSDNPCVMEGRLNYKKVTGNYRHQAVFKERWFRLVKNYLFYFKISEMGKFDTKSPAGVFVMENSSVQMEHGHHISFSFSISFIDEVDRRHVFAARSEDNVVQWVLKLRQCSYEYLRNQLHCLQSKVFSITGKDPLLLVPRNDGACLWAPSVPFSTAPACTVNTNSFSCHLHTNGAFTLERSKSDVQTHRHLRAEYQNKATFYTDTDIKKDKTKKDSHMFTVEKSKTSILTSSLNPIDVSIFDNRPIYSRAAPSPPVRKKTSPIGRTNETNRDIQVFTEQGRSLGQNSILDVAPVPPKRKTTPKFTEHGNNTSEISDEDLIKF